MKQYGDVNLNIAKGEHYKNVRILPEHVEQPLDPAFIATVYKLSPMMFTVLKKILVAGERGNKSYIQDIEDSIGALEREKELVVMAEKIEKSKANEKPF